MEKIIDTPTIQYTEYDKNCPFDNAAGIFDWLDGISESDIRDVVNQLMGNNCLNEKGMEVWKAIDVMTSGKATNDGVPQKTLDFYKKYDEWIRKNKIIKVECKISKIEEKCKNCGKVLPELPLTYHHNNFCNSICAQQFSEERDQQ